MKILPIILAVVGTGAGIGAGFVLKPAPPPEEEAEPECYAMPGEMPMENQAPPPEEEEPKEDVALEYVKMTNQFVVPIVGPTRVEAMVVASLSLEIDAGKREKVHTVEPKLRDVFLRVLLDHANIGGFSGNFTEAENMKVLRRALYEAARPVLGDMLHDILITEMARQDA